MSEHDELVYRDVPEVVLAGAKDGRDWYIAYLREGFTEEQAIALVSRTVVNVVTPLKKRWWQR